MISMWKPAAIKKKEPIKKKEHQKVFVFCSGKCGSCTLLTTFKSNGMKSIHIHGLAQYNNQNHKLPLFEFMDMSKQGEPVVVIDVYRLPVERKISSFFQNNDTEKPIQELVRAFNEQFKNIESYHSINDVFDHYKIPRFSSFDFKKRFITKTEQNMVFIKLHFNDISNWGSILSNAMGRPITIVSNNRSSEKTYYETYTRFKQQYKIPKEFLSIVENDPEFHIFNTPQEKKAYIEKWTANSI